MIKPYRIINTVELQQLERLFRQRVNQWSFEYSINPLTVQLTQPPKGHRQDTGFYLCCNQHNSALMQADYLQIMSCWLFGTLHESFLTSTESLASLLLNQLLDLDYFNLVPLVEQPDWFYPGSTSLMLMLSDGMKEIRITLAPEFVYQLLPTHSEVQDLGSFDDALAEQTVQLTIELAGLSLPINQLLNLQPGDVITTDHLLASPLRLKQKNHLFSEVELGQSLNYKSIIIKR